MFIGHYGPAFALKAVRPRTPLAALFIGVQLIDFAWAGFVVTGIEQVRIVPNFTAASSLDLHHMPYSHSLLASVLWALCAGAVYAIFVRKSLRLSAAMIIAAAVFSHWLADYFVHVPDLPLYPGGPKVGLGLWRSLVLSQALEAAFVCVGVAAYLITTKGRRPGAGISLVVLVTALLGVQIINLTPGAGPGTVNELALSGLAAFLVLAFLSWLADRNRERRIS